MKANELRIGNFILVSEDGKNFLHLEITAIDQSDDFKMFLEISKPIPLTEEWLVKFGFIHEKDTGEFTINGSNFVIIKLRIGVDLRERYEVFSHDFNPNILYVHQLQNLYFALTGEELEIKS